MIYSFYIYTTGDRHNFKLKNFADQFESTLNRLGLSYMREEVYFEDHR
jgi:DNA polymerase/3'-5' exonuclease PolX